MWDNSASNWVRHRMVECLMCYGQLQASALSLVGISKFYQPQQPLAKAFFMGFHNGHWFEKFSASNVREKIAVHGEVGSPCVLVKYYWKSRPRSTNVWKKRLYIGNQDLEQEIFGNLEFWLPMRLITSTILAIVLPTTWTPSPPPSYIFCKKNPKKQTRR